MIWFKQKNKQREREFYCPILRDPEGNEFCFELFNSPTEEECRRNMEEIRAEFEAGSDLRFTGEIHKVEDRQYHLIRFGDDPSATAFVLSGPMLDRIMALPSRPNVSEGIVQDL